MKLVVGLGNPGKKYEGTRHNIGFEVVRELARRNAQSKPKSAFDGEAVEANMRNERCLLLCPSTFMNRSGQSVQKARDFFKLENEDLLVICDDFSLSVGTMRVRPKGSAGGQNGLKDIINRVGQDFSRLRIGIGPVPDRWDAADFVLGKFDKQEREEMQHIVVRAADAVEDWVSEGTEFCMNRYNAAPN
ncbi:MAG: aminoacyl-tRNA hydrolase [Pirellulales bacterium]|nr:aminoacyl-tRNA hydrolase [Pirellulales bacterium]